MALLGTKDQQYLKKRFAEEISRLVEVVLFTGEPAKSEVSGRVETRSPYQKENREFLTELANLSDLVELVSYDLDQHADVAKEYGISHSPVIIVRGKGEESRFRYFGIPAGYELATIVEAILNVGRGNTKLHEATKEMARAIRKPVHLQVFVTPT